MVHARNEITHYSYSGSGDWDYAPINTWSTGNGSSSVCMWNADSASNPSASGYYMVFVGREGADVGILLNGATIKFATKQPTSYNDGTLKVKPYTFILYRKG